MGSIHPGTRALPRLRHAARSAGAAADGRSLGQRRTLGVSPRGAGPAGAPCTERTQVKSR